MKKIIDKKIEKRKYFIVTIGCQMNIADSERLAAFLDTSGFRAAKDLNQADVVILNTCGIKQAAEDRVYGLVNQIRKNNKKAQIIVSGCLSRRPDVKKRLAGRVDMFLPINEMIKLPESLQKGELEPYFSLDEVRLEIGEKYLNIVPIHKNKFSAYVPIGNGCNNFCSYCVVPYARGREVYRPSVEIISEVKKLIRNGYKEINLIAQNVNSYKDGDYDFSKLLLEVANIPGKFWLRFSSSHPKDMSAKLITALGSSDKICSHLHLAVQSGDNTVLKNMNRQYTVEHFKNLISKVRKAKPGIAITTDIIVGFPGETKKNFLNTVSLFKDIRFDLAYISPYSPRPGTVSSRMKDNVNQEEKKRRAVELNDLLRKIALENNARFLNEVVEILVEGKNKCGKYYGKTSGYLTVLANVPKSLPAIQKKKLIGEFVSVRINKVLPFGLEGDLVTE